MKVLTVFAHPDPKSFCRALLDRFVEGLRDGGHEPDVADLYAEKFDPVFRSEDMSFFLDDSVPDFVLDRMRLKEKIIEQAGGPIRRALARRWLRGKTDSEIIRAARSRRPRAIVREQRRVADADGMAFISPVFWLGFPAIMKGWVERVLTYGTAYQLTADGWRGALSGRVPLLHHRKAVIINTTFFGQKDYEPHFVDAMRTTIDSWAFRYPGIKQVEHHYLWAVNSVGPETRARYLEQTYQLGLDFDNSSTEAMPLGRTAAIGT